ncbi:hypothetical protein ACFV24_29880, partial [Nocardia fluminea]
HDIGKQDGGAVPRGGGSPGVPQGGGGAARAETAEAAADAELADAHPQRQNGFKIPLARNVLVATLRELSEAR